ncbi:MAG: hypothetical protein IJ187_00750 [Neisseriaceae bacterium]|nr:hypothetical protein [Neisseriaceae bacterium]
MMKKIPIKLIIGWIAVIAIFWVITYIQYLYNMEQKNSNLSCVPKNPINKDIIYAKTMQKYWQRTMNDIQGNYSMLKRGHHPVNGDAEAFAEASELERVCGLKEQLFSIPKFTKNTCFPLVTFDKRKLKVYHPEKDDYLYQPKHYNKDTNFYIQHSTNNYRTTTFYTEDCCKLLTYEEMNSEINQIKENEHFHIYQNIKNIDINLLKRIYFLRIKTNYNSHNFYYFTYYPVSLCGHARF